ncbi:MAG: formyl-CoA transferase [Chloroflexi bacterium]|nr:MAG: formyl-CoA transferase [Chloroflexota bacterium]
MTSAKADTGVPHGPLTGLRVIDFTRVLAGPYCTMLLGDMGAEVIKIEQPGVGDDTRAWGPPYLGTESGYFLAVNRNKRGIALDLRETRGRDIALSLVRDADIVVENFRVGVMERLGLGYEQLRELNPGIIYASISGFGRSGPYADRPGYDLIAEAMSGFMSVTGEPEGVGMRAGVAVGDVTTGMMATIAILAALQHRNVTGEGQLVEASLLDTLVGWLINANMYYLITGRNQPRSGNAHALVVPYQAFQARDLPMIITAGNDKLFAGLCRVVGRPDLIDDPRFRSNADRSANRAALVEQLEAALKERDAEEWTELLLHEGVPAGPINTMAEVFSNPQVLARNMLVEVDHASLGRIKIPGVPMKFSATPAEARDAPPLRGEDTRTVLRDIVGLDDAAIDELLAAGVVEQWTKPDS